ncbi:MAG: alanine racemase [Spirochaetota bacterium]|nr:MAG: alanine racemase [Spirochaetota bacterium]
MINVLRERIYNKYKSAIGKSRSSLVTPALIFDLNVAKHNIQLMFERMQEMPAKLRPHIKVQKCIELAKMQIEAGAIGICTATVWEAIVMSNAGIEDVLIANEVVGKEKIKALAEAARCGKLSLAVDNVQNSEDLSNAAREAGSELGILIEVDIGMRKGGVRSAEEALTLAQHLRKLPNLRFLGVQGYEGHCMGEFNRVARMEKVKQAMDYLGEVILKLAKAGFECKIVSCGGTGTFDITGTDSRVTEIQAGTYVFMDKFHVNLVPDFKHSLTVLSTVIIKHGNTVVMDAGRKSIGVDFAMPTMVDYPNYEARGFHEEHALFDVDKSCKLKIGDTVELIPGYTGTTVNFYDAYHVVEDDVVVDIWPVIPRGPGHSGILSS